MAMFGWQSPKRAALFTRKADRNRLAREAMRLLVPAKSVPLFDVVQPGGTIRGKIT